MWSITHIYHIDHKAEDVLAQIGVMNVNFIEFV